MIREAGEPASVREIAEVLARKTGRELGKREFAIVVARVRNALPRVSDQLTDELRGRTTYWVVKEPP